MKKTLLQSIWNKQYSLGSWHKLTYGEKPASVYEEQSNPSGTKIFAISMGNHKRISKTKCVTNEYPKAAKRRRELAEPAPCCSHLSHENLDWQNGDDHSHSYARDTIE